MKRPEPSDELKALASGTRVSVRRDDGSVQETTTRSKPWKLGGHTWVVLLEGISGGYLLDRVRPIEMPPSSEAVAVDPEKPWLNGSDPAAIIVDELSPEEVAIRRAS